MSKQRDQIAELLTDDSFLRWIKDEANSLEQQKWDRWLEEDPANIAIVRQAKQQSRSLQFREEQPDTLKELRKLEDALTKKEVPNRKIKRVGMATKRWMRVAAAVVLLLTVIGIARYANWGSEQQQQVERPVLVTAETDYGEVRKLTFSDGSQITLNAHSKLTYPKTHKGGDMEVELQGEAYFSIVHKTGNQKRTFSVRTPQGKIAVLGTQFNVNARSGNTEVVLEEGEVHVETADTLGSVGHNYMMKPGELVRLQAGLPAIEAKKVDTELYTSWRNFELKFKSTPLIQIADRLKEIYGVDVEFRDESLQKVEFSGSAPNKNFAVLLEGLRTLLNIPIVHNENTITFGAR